MGVVVRLAGPPTDMANWSRANTIPNPPITDFRIHLSIRDRWGIGVSSHRRTSARLMDFDRGPSVELRFVSGAR